ncbi:CpaF family protein [Paenibacillus sacheonensis]|uniref:CpaF family protein n=1 Tax=Paenibacillus sacheonensis TaxID=742054 RepID=A0A7X5C2S2_9BACL|nr:CpaF family protein [Paenibacillus sacheonensis]MBM7566943.1 pilus assembly protein CpaF [Paenibacillus sacheonensis]NBC71565.1 CpaF family protein [Paenibacillus sacheonensis]
MHEETVQLLKERIRGQLELDSSLTDGELTAKIERVVFGWCAEHPLPAGEKIQLVRRLFHAFRGLDLIQPLMDDPTVTEIMINGHEELFVERGGQLMRLPFGFESRERLEDLIQSVVAGVNRVVNESSPIVDARLKDGSRVHIVLPPIALKGPTMTIRKFPDKPLLMQDLIKLEVLPDEAAALLEKLVRAKYNIFISGGTGSGKTTLLNALSQFIPDDERIVTIEDAAELQIVSVPNLVTMETRNANTEGKGAISMRELIRASLRMRPNRIIVGEVRGGEAIDMLQAMNTGHDGSLSTGHSNSARDMIARLETMALSGAELPVAVIRQQIASAIDIIVHVARLRDRSRRVTEICEVTGVVNGEVTLQSLYRFEEEGERDGRFGGLKRAGNELQRAWKLRMAGISDVWGGKGA